MAKRERRRSAIRSTIVATVAALILTLPDHTSAAEPACARLASQADYRAYATAVYERPTISRAARRRLARMERCQHSSQARRNVRRLRRQLARERKRRAELGARSGVKAYAYRLLVRNGRADEWSCLLALWERESGWRWWARNPTSGAYGIPQSLPASKLAAAGRDWQTNPHTQVRWGLQYLALRYNGPCGGWAHSQKYGWY